MSTGREVSKKSIFPPSFDLSTVFKFDVSFYLSRDLIEAFHFLTAIKNGE